MSGESSTWAVKSLYQLNAETNLGYSGDAVNGSFGFDTLGLPGASAGVATVSADRQVVAGISTDVFYVGSLGVNAGTVNFTSNMDIAPSLLSSLKSSNQIPSQSFGYTAGASYSKSACWACSFPTLTYPRARWRERISYPRWLRYIEIHS